MQENPHFVPWLRALVRGLLLGLMALAVPAWAQTATGPIVAAEYFIDIDPGPGNGGAIPLATPADSVDLSHSVDVSQLAPGYHELVVRVKDSLQHWSIAQKHLFYINPLQTPIVPPPPPFTLVAAEYFVDQDPGPGNGIGFPLIAGDSVQIIRNIPTSGWSSGAHTVGVRFKDLAGAWSTVKTYEVDVFQDTLNIAALTADFSWTTPVVGQPVQFTNSSTGMRPGRRFQWDIGADGSVEYTAKDIQHTFQQPGIYDVLMRVSNRGTQVDTAGLMGLYRFYNASRTNYHGPLGTLIKQGGIQRMNGRHGDPFGAFTTEGVTQLSSLTGASASPMGMQELSVSYWFKGSQSQYLLNLLDDNSGGVTSTYSSRHYVYGNSSDNIDMASLHDDSWHHVAFTWTPDSVDGFRFYFDGERKGERNTSNYSLQQLDSIVLGAKGSQQALGGFDDVFLFDRVLSDTEVYTLYNEAVTDAVVYQILVGPLPPNQIANSGADTICSGDSIYLTAPVGTNHLWSTGDTAQQILVTSSGQFTCAYTDIHGNSRTSEAKHIEVQQTPLVIAHVATATNGLSNGSIQLDISGGTGAYTVSWSHGPQGPRLIQLPAGVYTASVDDGNCPRVYDFVVSDSLVPNPSGLVRAEAFIDTDPGPGNGIPLAIPELHNVDCHLDISAAGLLPGDHFLGLRVLQADGNWSVVQTRRFNVQDTAATNPLPQSPIADVVAAEYYFDTDPGPGNGLPIAIHPMDSFINMNLNILIPQGLSTGNHVMALRVKDSYGHWSVIFAQDVFVDVIAPPNLPAFRIPIVAAEYFFDDTDPGPGNAMPLAVSPQDSLLEVHRSVDVSGLGAGTHALNVRVRDVSGQWSVLGRNTFDVDSSCVPPQASFSFGYVTAGAAAQFNNTSTNVSPLAMYYWDIGADGSVEYNTQDMLHVFGTSGIFDVKLSVVNLDSCYSEYIAQVRVDPIPNAQLAVIGPTVFCSGDTTTLTAPPGSGYIWNTLDTTRNLRVHATGSYWVSYLDAQGDLRKTDVVQISVPPSMVVQSTLLPEVNGLGNGGILLDISGGSRVKYDILWSTGDTTRMLSNMAAGTYSVVIDDGTCPQSLQFTIPATTVQPLEGIVAAEYFIGTDPGVRSANALVVNPGSPSNSMTQLSTWGLSPGIYPLYMRVMDDEGVWSHLVKERYITIVDTAAPPAPEPAESVVEVEYYFDTDPGPGNGTSVPGLLAADSIDIAWAIATSSLTTGPHLLIVRAKDSGGDWSTPVTRYIYILDAPSPASPLWPLVQAEYFRGADPGPGNATPLVIPLADSVDLTRIIDVSSLPPGSYTYYIRVRDQSRIWSHLESFSLQVQPSNCLMPQAEFVYTTASAGQSTFFYNTSLNQLGTATVEWDIDADGTIDYQGNNISHSFAFPGYYDVLLTVDNGGGCSQQYLEQIRVEPLPSPQISMQPTATEICECDSTTLTAFAGEHYLWSTGDSTQSIVVRQSGIYNVVITDNQGTRSFSQSIQITSRPKPIISTQVSPAHNGGSDGTASVTAASGGTGFLYSYLWSTGATSTSLTGLSAGTYWVTVSDGFCSTTDTLIVQDVPMSPLAGVIRAEYFFDDQDPGPGAGIPLNYGYGPMVASIENIPVPALSYGMHTLWVRVKEDDGMWSFPKRHLFIVPDTTSYTDPDWPITDVEYFIDTDQGPSFGTSLISGAAFNTLDTALSTTMPSLVSGTHTLGIRVKDAGGNWSVIKTQEINNCLPPAVPLAGPDNDICPGDTIYLTSTFAGTDPVYWTSPDGTTYSGTDQSIWATDSTYEGHYLVYSEGPGNCRSAYDTVFVNVREAPVNPGDIRLNPTAVCATSDTVNLLVDHQADATSYQWILPTGVLILAGNNTNNVTVDLTGWADSAVVISVVVGNNCGSDTSNSMLLTRCGNVLPVVATSATYALSGDSATSGGLIIHPGASSVFRAGICIAQHADPDTTDRVILTMPGATNFNMSFGGLVEGNFYYVRAFAENSQGVAYGNERMMYTPTQCPLSIDSITVVNANQGVYQAHFGLLPQADAYKFEFKSEDDAVWRSKVIKTRNQAIQRFNITPWFDDRVELRLTWRINGVWIEGCTSYLDVPCKPQVLSVVVQRDAFCEGDSVLLRAGYAGGYSTPSFLWHNGSTTKRTYVSPGDTATITVTDLAGCAITEKFVAPQFVGTARPVNFGLKKLNATTFELSWDQPQLPAGASLIGYRVAYRLRNTQSWTNTSLTTDTFKQIDFTGTSLPSGNYEFVAFTRYNDGVSGPTNSGFTCKEVKGYNGSGGKTDGSGMTGQDSELVRVYPNPTYGELFVHAPRGAQVQLSDMHGKTLLTWTMRSSEQVVDLSPFASGVYLMNIRTDSGTYTRQIIRN